MPKIEFLGKPIWVGGRSLPKRPKPGNTYHRSCDDDCIRSDGKLAEGCVYMRRWDKRARKGCAVRVQPATRKPSTRKATTSRKKSTTPRKRRMSAAESRWAALYPELQGTRMARPRRRTARRRIARR